MAIEGFGTSEGGTVYPITKRRPGTMVVAATVAIGMAAAGGGLGWPGRRGRARRY